jgi:predicted  nucleic acid-binding Zn-ribbon protein
MSEKINLSSETVNIREFNRVVNTEFTSFIDTVPEDELTVEEFFVEYERLFYDIPAEGEFESHEYLIRKSSELVELETDSSDIQPLLDEIANLREQLLESNSRVNELENELALKSTAIMR